MCCILTGRIAKLRISRHRNSCKCDDTLELVVVEVLRKRGESDSETGVICA